MGAADLVTIKDVILITETEKALGIAIVEDSDCKTVQYWAPKSLVDMTRGLEKCGQVGEIDVPRWWAEKNNLEYEE